MTSQDSPAASQRIVPSESDSSLLLKAVGLANQSVRNRLSVEGPLSFQTPDPGVESTLVDKVYSADTVRMQLLRRFANLQEGGSIDNFRLSSLLSFFQVFVGYLEQTHDETVLQEPVGGMHLGPYFLKCMHEVWAQRRDSGSGLLYNSGGLDAYELEQNAHQFPRAARYVMAYPNLYFFGMLKRLTRLELFAKEDVEGWTMHCDSLGRAIHRHFWDTNRKQLRGIAVTDSLSLDPEAEWVPFLPHSSALFLASGLVDGLEREQIVEQFAMHLNRGRRGPFGMSVSPSPPEPWRKLFYPRGYTHEPHADHTQMCGRSVQAFFEAGEQGLGYRLLRRLAEKAVEDGGFFPWYSEDGCPQGDHPSPQAARAFLHGYHVYQEAQQEQGADSAAGGAADPGENWDSVPFLKPSFEERRAQRRLPLELPGELRLHQGFRGLKLNGIIRFPSMAGMAFQSVEEIPVDSRVNLRVDLRALGGKKVCTLRGRVVWSRSKVMNILHQCGIELDARSPDLKLWCAFIQEKIDFLGQSED